MWACAAGACGSLVAAASYTGVFNLGFLVCALDDGMFQAGIACLCFTYTIL